MRRPPSCYGRRDGDLDGGHDRLTMEPMKEESPSVEMWRCPRCGATVRP